MRRAISILTGILLLAATGCDLPKVLTRVEYAQIGADGIAVSFNPRSEHNSDANDDDFLSSVFDVGSVVSPLMGFFF